MEEEKWKETLVKVIVFFTSFSVLLFFKSVVGTIIHFAWWTQDTTRRRRHRLILLYSVHKTTGICKDFYFAILMVLFSGLLLFWRYTATQKAFPLSICVENKNATLSCSHSLIYCVYHYHHIILSFWIIEAFYVCMYVWLCKLSAVVTLHSS